MSDEITVGKYAGKCTRCHRALKKVFVVDGAAYGPICVRKLFPLLNVTAEGGADIRHRKEHGKPQDTAQPTIFPSGTSKYIGCRSKERDLFEVVCEDASGAVYPLNPRLDLVNHSPTGLAWGYGGSGPAQCSLAILADYLGDDRQALDLYQEFKFKVIAALPMDQGWELNSKQIESAITYINLQRMKTAI